VNEFPECVNANQLSSEAYFSKSFILSEGTRLLLYEKGGKAQKRNRVFRLLLLPFGIAPWILGWFLYSVGSTDRRLKSDHKKLHSHTVTRAPEHV